MDRTCVGVASVLLAASSSWASIAFVMNSAGVVRRFDPYGSDPVVTLGGGGWASDANGFTIDSDGVGWGIASGGTLRRFDLAAGTSVGAGNVPRPGQTGFYKDLTWDAVNNRVLALHFAVTVTIGVLNTSDHSFTSLGTVSGLSPVAHVTGFGMSPGGQMTLGDAANGYIWDLAPTPGGFSATARPIQSTGGSLAGIDYDPSTGDLLTSEVIFRILPDGSRELLRTGISGTDIAFVPIPAPAASCLVVGLTAAWGVRRRRGGVS